MNLSLVDQLAKALLYEGYMLYPYRPSSVKNQQRFNFGVVYPKAYSDAQGGDEPSVMRVECLLLATTAAQLEIRFRFLQLQTRSILKLSGDARSDIWQEVAEREVAIPAYGLHKVYPEEASRAFAFRSRIQTNAQYNSAGDLTGCVERQQRMIEGTVQVTASLLSEKVFKVSIVVSNTTPLQNAAINRDEALLQSLVSAHIVLGVSGGEFVSLLEPPAEMQHFAMNCTNTGAWPVLVGEPGQRDTILASPIILYDYPQIALESAGDLFDGTEIDEILSLRIMTLTDEEKREIRQSDDRARQILDRTENMPAEQFMKLHGAVRGLRPLNSRNDLRNDNFSNLGSK
jgi:hypothetical protein